MAEVLAYILKIARQNKRLSQENLAASLKISRSSIQSYERGQTIPKYGVLKQLANILECEDLLRLGIEEERKKRFNENIIPVAALPHIRDEVIDGSPKKVNVPLIANEFASWEGSFENSVDIIKYIEITKDIIKFNGPVGSLFFMSVKGDLMLPVLAYNDLVLIDRDQTKPYPGGVFALAHDYGLYIKRTILEPGKLVLRSDNSYYKDTILDSGDEAAMSQVRIIGRAVWWCHDDGPDDERLNE